ncbi:MAG: chemotaxis protein CheA [Candidatus Competibacteraceae bacterium]
MIELDPSLINDFVTETSEHLEEMESALLRLATDPADKDLFNSVFRRIHTIKGASQFMGLVRVAALSHKLEDLLDLLRQGKKPSNQHIIETLIIARDRITMLVADLARSQTEETPVDDLIAHLDRLIEGSEETGDATEVAAMAEAEAAAMVEAEAAAMAEVAVAEEMPKVQQSPVVSSQEMETYEEEYDKELFAIFIQQLQEKLSFLGAQAEQLPSAFDKFEAFEHCLENITSLRSSANYMGYKALTLLYEEWCDEILAAQQAAAMDQEVSTDFMDAYIARVVKLFPQYGDSLLQGADEQSKAAAVAGVAPPEVAEEPLEKEPLISPSSVPVAPAKAVAARIGPVESSPATTAAPQPIPAPKRSVVAKEAGEPVMTVEKTLGEDEAEQQKTEQLRATGEQVVKKSVRVDAHKIDILMNQVGELIVDRSYFFQLFNEMKNLQQHLKVNAGLDPKDMKMVRAFTYRLGEAIVSLSRTSNELQEGVMKVRMLPIAQLFNRYPRLIHDLTHGTAKQVQLEVRGEDTELDRMIIEEVSDPLIHIIRNAVDHGFETTTERKRLGKPAVGTLLLEAYHESNHIVIEITDDGRGMDPALIKAKALEKKLSSKEELERMSDRELLRLVMLPSFSTAAEVTNTSGRGVGMDVVKKNIEKLNGTIDIESVVGAQTRIRLKIPLTLAIIAALMVRVSDNLFTVPLANVEETLRIFAKDITTVEDIEVIHLRGKTMPIFRLATLFDIPSSQQETDKFFVVIVNAGLRKIGLVVDELLGQEEVVIKPLVDYLQEKSGLSGATIIGDGRISLILDVYELANIAMNRQIAKYQGLSFGRRKAVNDKTGYPTVGKLN